MPAAADRLFSISVRVNGREDPGFYQCIQSIKVEENVRQGSSFEIVVALCRKEDGSWPHLDAPDFKPWTRIRLKATVGEVSDVVMDGYISDVHVSTTPSTASLEANFAGVDASYVMDLQQRVRVWSEKTYEQIAEEIIRDRYNLVPVLPTANGASGSTPPPSVTQRNTDLRFLRDLARRRGYEVYAAGANIYFRPPDLESTPQKLIASNFGHETNCDDLRFSVDGTSPTQVVLARQDPVTGETTPGSGSDSGLQALGTANIDEARGYGVGHTRVLPRGPLTIEDPNLAVRVYMMRHGFWLKASGALDALRYGAILRAGKTVTIKGFGTDYNGVYYVRKVVHNFTPRSYRMQFEAFRNRLGQTGAEDLTGEDPSDSASPPALGPGAGDLVDTREDGNRVVAV